MTSCVPDQKSFSNTKRFFIFSFRKNRKEFSEPGCELCEFDGAPLGGRKVEVCGGEGEEGGAKHGVVTSVAQEETSTEKTQ